MERGIVGIPGAGVGRSGVAATEAGGASATIGWSSIGSRESSLASATIGWMVIDRFQEVVAFVVSLLRDSC